MVYRVFACLFYLAAAVAVGLTAHTFRAGYPMTLGLGGAVPLLLLLTAGLLVALGNYARRSAGPR